MEEDGLTIRFAKPADARAVERVLQRAYDQYRGRVKPPFQALSATAGDIAAEIRARGKGYLVAEVDGEIVGVIRYHRSKTGDGRVLELARLAVDPAYRGGGVGKKLLAEAERRAVQAGMVELRGCVRASLPGLLDYYGGLGFRPVGRRSKPGYPRYLIVIRKRIGTEPPGIK